MWLSVASKICVRRPHQSRGKRRVMPTRLDAILRFDLFIVYLCERRLIALLRRHELILSVSMSQLCSKACQSVSLVGHVWVRCLTSNTPLFSCEHVLCRLLILFSWLCRSCSFNVVLPTLAVIAGHHTRVCFYLLHEWQTCQINSSVPLLACSCASLSFQAYLRCS